MDVLTKVKNNSNDNFRKMIENLDVGFYKGDSDGNLLMYNRALKEILGFEPSKDLAGNLAEYFFKNKADQKKFYRELMEMGRVKDYIVQVKKPNGKIIMVQINAHVVKEFDDKLTTIEGNVIDISEIYQLEHRLNESEENYRTFMETAKDFMHIIDNKGKIIYANRDFFGYKKEELMNMRITELIAEEELPIFTLKLKSLIGNGSITLTDLSCKSKDGTKIIGELSAVAIYGTDGKFNGAISIFNDITERKKMEEKLLNNEELFRDFFESGAVGFHIFGPDRIITKMNEYELNLLGYSREEIIDKKTWYDIIIPEQRQQFEKHWNDILEKGSVKNLEYTLIHKDGHFIDVLLNASSRFDEKGNLINTRGSVLNITERRKMEEKLLNNEELFRDFFESAAIGFHIFGPDRIITKMNEYELNLLGYSREEIVDKKIWYDLIIPEQRHQFEKHWNDILDKGSVNNLEYTLIHKDGHFIDVLLNASSRFDDNGNLINTRGSVLNITERKKMEEEMEKYRDHLEYLVRERIKELNCLYGVTKIIEEEGLEIENVLAKAVDLLPLAWQFPEITCARISFHGQEFKTKNFKETTWKQKACIKIRDEIIGKIEVYYLKDKPIFDEGPFLKEERNLINALTEILGRYFEREMVEQKLKESEEKFRVLFENTNDAIFIHRGSQFIEVNQTACERLGYTREELLKLNPKNITPPGYKVDIQANIKALQEKGELMIEAEHITKDGTIVPVEISSRIFNFGGKNTIISVARDITERKVVDQELKESEKKYKSLSHELDLILDNIPALIFYKDLNNNFIRVNKYLADAHKMPKESIEGKSLFDIYPKKVAQNYWDDDLEVVNTKLPKLNIEEPWDTAQGRRWVNTSKIPIINNSGKIESIIGISTDITDRKNSEQKLREAFDRTNFYKDLLTHDMNNILQVIQFSLDISLLEENVSKELKESLESTKSQVLRGSKLISNVQKLSQLEESQKSLQNIEICNVLKDSLNFLKKSFKMKKINVKIETPRKSYLVKANNIIREVFENILINAVKYNENSTIEILIRFSEEKKEEINYIKMEFIDNGRGIPDSIKKIIFVKGFLEEKQSTGMGIGLTLVKKAIETYNGQIWVEDRITGDYSKGSNFILMIPEAFK